MRATDRQSLRLVFVFDGLRASDVAPERTPTLNRLALEGSSFTGATTVTPSLTRAAAATLATGCLPTRTGVFGNIVWLPDTGNYLDTGSYRQLRAIEARHRLPATPTLSELLEPVGDDVAVVGTGSGGCAHLLNPAAASRGLGVVVRISDCADSAWVDPLAAQERISRLHPPPSAARVAGDPLARLEWAVAIAKSLIHQDSPKVLVFWCGEPDAVQHMRGLGSAAALAAIRAGDRALAELIDAGETLGRPVDAIVASDHGALPVAGALNATAEIERAFGPDAGLGVAPNDAVLLLSTQRSRTTTRAVVDWAHRQPWVHSCISVAGCGTSQRRGHPFAPDVVLVMHRDAQRHAAVTRATAVGDDVELLAVHGGTHPDELKIPLVLHGPSFRRRAEIADPAGLQDITPTLLHLAGLLPPGNLDGRVLCGALNQRAARPERTGGFACPGQGTR